LKGARKPVNIGTDEFVWLRDVRAGEMSGREPTFYLVYFQAKRRRAFGAEFQDMAFDVEQIRATGQRVAASHGLDVVEIEFLGGAKHRILRVFIEKNAEERKKLADQAEDARSLEAAAAAGAGVDQLAGVTHEDCAAFSRDFGTVLDVEDLIPGGEYTLEVSSPGLDRKLKGMEDFRRFAGLLAKVQTFEPVAGNRHWQGRILEVDEGSLKLGIESKSKGQKKKSPEPRTQSAGKTGSSEVEIALSNIEKANLVPEI
jgi:ribosome maturation factor RimP